jgi:multicomponent Na+:H+ antiporter subunit C
MSGGLAYALAGAALFGVALFAWQLQADLLRRILAFNVMGSGTFLILIGLASQTDGATDPVPQALVLTGIIVAVAATALALALMRHWYAISGRRALPEDDQP